jgi:hypothetical protein
MISVVRLFAVETRDPLNEQESDGLHGLSAEFRARFW